MEYIKKHGFKIAWMQLLGLIAFGLIYLGTYVVAFLIMLAVGASEALMAESLSDVDQLGVGAILAMIVVYLGLWLAQLIVGVMSTGASYGSSIEAVFQNRSSISLYFHHAFHHLKQLTLQALIFYASFIPAVLIFIPLSLVFVESTPVLEIVGLGLLFLFIITYTLCAYAIMAFAPIMVIKEGKTAWESIKHSAMLWKRAFGKCFASVLKAFLTALGIVLGYGLILLILTAVTAISFDNDISGLGTMSMIFLVLFGVFFVIFIGPFAMTSAYLILVGQYKEHLRPILFPEPAPLDEESQEQPKPEPAEMTPVEVKQDKVKPDEVKPAEGDPAEVEPSSNESEQKEQHRDSTNDKE